MSGYQHFKAVLAELKLKASKQEGVYITPDKNPLLLEKGVILVSQKDVRRLDLARSEFALAMQKIQTAKAALHGFGSLSMTEVDGVQSLLDSYNKTIDDIVNTAYARRRAALVGVVA